MRHTEMVERFILRALIILLNSMVWREQRNKVVDLTKEITHYLDADNGIL